MARMAVAMTMFQSLAASPPEIAVSVMAEITARLRLPPETSS